MTYLTPEEEERLARHLTLGNFAERLDRAILLAGSSEALADALGISKDTIRQWMTGRRCPTLVNQAKVRAYNRSKK